MKLPFIGSGDRRIGKSVYGDIGSRFVLSQSLYKSAMKSSNDSSSHSSVSKAPELSIISKKIDAIAKIAAQLGLVSKQELALLKDRNKQAQRLVKEQTLEHSELEPETKNDISGLDKLKSPLELLTIRINKLIDTLDNSGKSSPSMDLHSIKSKRFKPKMNASAMKKIASNDNVLSKSSRMSQVIGSAIRKGSVAAGKVGIASAVRKLAKPIIAKGLGRSVLKSIPILGAVAGVGFAVSKLIDGDVVGAGLEAASGLAGPMTAIPALIASVARDTYASVYGINPEEDPNFGFRMPEVTNEVKKLVTETITPAVQPMNKPKISSSSVVTPVAASVSSSGGQASPTTQTPENKNVSSGTSVTQQSKPEQNTQHSLPENKPQEQTRSSIKPEEKRNIKSSMIIEKSISNAEAQRPEIQKTLQRTTIPRRASRNMTSRSGSIGIGNVPDPNYYGFGSISDQIYFSSVVR